MISQVVDSLDANDEKKISLPFSGGSIDQQNNKSVIPKGHKKWARVISKAQILQCHSLSFSRVGLRQETRVLSSHCLLEINAKSADYGLPIVSKWYIFSVPSS